MFVAEVGNVTVATTNHRAHSSEELARMAVRKIIYVGDDLPTEISSQAEIYKNKLFQVILGYITLSRRSEREDIIRALERAGMSEAVMLIRSL
tara:strand:+ start:1145 stop:1423 length:279 start_codon:yes stop_codon:yes gene_type:complete